MFRFRRDDVYKRNEWTNYTNWDFENKLPMPLQLTMVWTNGNDDNFNFITPNMVTYPRNEKNILQNMALILNGDYRENIMDNGVYLYCEKYSRTNGTFKDGLYHYSFALNTDFNTYQPSGSMNMSKFDHISFEYNTITPPNNDDSKVEIICSNDGELLGIRQDSTEIYKYNYDFKVFEERYNVITLSGGNINLMFTN
tara:strand:+ start:17 stop:607 length:591 start_codon:yes stop_codon:yes gene_type:complete